MGDFVPLGATGETIYGKIRRLAMNAARANPRLIDPATGLPTLLPSAQAPALDFAIYANVAAATSAGFSKAFLAQQGTSPNFYLNPVFLQTGGWTAWAAGTYLGGPVVTQYPTGTGNFSSNPAISSGVWRVHFRVDAADFVVVTSQSAAMRLLVDGQYVSLSNLAISTTVFPALTLVDFTAAGGRRWRDITLEFTGSTFRGVYVRPDCEVVAPKIKGGDRLRMSVYGDSITTGSGASPQCEGFAGYLGDRLGIVDTWWQGIGSTGWNTPVINTCYAAEEHIFDITNNNFDLVVFAHNVNSYGQGGGGAAAWNSYAKPAWMSAYKQLRAAMPTTPLFQIGILDTNDATMRPSAIPYETAQKADVQALMASDPNLFYVPCATDPNGSWFTGKQDGSNGNRAWYFGASNGGAHPNTLGHQMVGYTRLAQGILEAIGKKP